MKSRTLAAVAMLIALPLAGCQTPQESASRAEDTCSAQGIRPGTARYKRCVQATYSANRQQAQEASNAAVAGAAVGVLGGALAGAAIANDGGYYHRGYRRW